MKTENISFGVLIAYILPGFIFLWGLSFSQPGIASWLAKSAEEDTPTVGGFLYSALASLSLGLIISAVRWLIVDHFHHLTGVKRPNMNFGSLKEKDRLAAFEAAVKAHYHHYQYYANTFVAIIGAFGAHVYFEQEKPSILFWIIIIAILVSVFFGSRDALRKYYDRAEKILA